MIRESALKRSSFLGIGLLLVIVLLLAVSPTGAQEAVESPTLEPTYPPYPADTGIYVTTQDFMNLRVGPGEYFEVLDVVDPEVTLMAIGRTADTRWVQVVEPSGRTGWLFVRFLVYSGDVVTLPVDGVNPVPFIRQAGAVGVTTREAILYDRRGEAVGTLAAGTRLELTGRLGSGVWSRYQVLINNELYWMGAWDIRVVSGNTVHLFDTAYLYPYGRVLRQLDDDLNITISALNRIEELWRRVQGGARTSCANIPGLTNRTITDFDAQQEVLFGPAVIALDEANASANAAISAFEDLCLRAQTDPNTYVTQSDIRSALDHIEDARLNLNLVTSMYAPLERRDPLLTILSGSVPNP